MKHTYVVRYVTKEQALRQIKADSIKYTGGAVDTIVAFYADTGAESPELISVVSMQPGMSVERLEKAA